MPSSPAKQGSVEPRLDEHDVRATKERVRDLTPPLPRSSPRPAQQQPWPPARRVRWVLHPAVRRALHLHRKGLRPGVPRVARCRLPSHGPVGQRLSGPRDRPTAHGPQHARCPNTSSSDSACGLHGLPVTGEPSVGPTLARSRSPKKADRVLSRDASPPGLGRIGRTRARRARRPSFLARPAWPDSWARPSGPVWSYSSCPALSGR